MLNSIFPFGRRVLPRPPSASDPRRLFILGAYPSALHVAWAPPAPLRPIKAIAVDNEPEPFWTGADEEERIAAWKVAVGWDDARWGTVRPVGRLNGSSGAWVEGRVLKPLGVTRVGAWITDCLDAYRCSDDLDKRIEETYAPFAEGHGLPPATLASHPTEADIIAEALRDHRERLESELATAQPKVVVTLGNAALRVLASLVVVRDGGQAPWKLSPEPYGRTIPIRVGGLDADWLPLAHPAAPRAYQVAHETWVRRHSPH